MEKPFNPVPVPVANQQIANMFGEEKMFEDEKMNFDNMFGEQPKKQET